MSYTPIIPMTGNAGWSFLQRTLETQKTAFESSTVTKRDTDYFAHNVWRVMFGRYAAVLHEVDTYGYPVRPPRAEETREL